MTRRDAPLVLAFDIGGTTVKAEVVGPDLRPERASAAPTPRGDASAALETVRVLGCELLDRRPSGRPGVARVGLAVPGLVNAAEGRVVFSANVGWTEVDLAGPVRDAFGLPVAVVHDVAAAGLAEWRRGAGKGVDDLLVVVIGTGIGAVIVAGGRLVHGGLQQAGELGHVIVRPDGPVCACGQRGCVEALGSATAIARAYEAATGRRVDGAAAVHGLLGSDPAADAAWADAVDALADGVLAACTLLAPARVVVAGGLAAAGEDLLAPLRARLAGKARVTAVPEVVAGAFGGRAGVVGAAMRAQGQVDP